MHLRVGAFGSSVSPDRRDDPWPDEPDEFDPEERFGFGEPEEFDPEERWGDPERDLVQVPEPPEPGSVDEELQRTFWASVFLVNVGVAGVSLGLMLVYFRGMWLVGLGAVGVGAFALARTFLYYREFKRERIDGDTDTDVAVGADGGAADADDSTPGRDDVSEP
jgi:hypothetical protein